MDKFRESSRKYFRAGVLRSQEDGYTQSAQNQSKTQAANTATNRNANSIVVNNYIDRSGEVSENHELPPRPPVVEREAIIPISSIVTEIPEVIETHEEIPEAVTPTPTNERVETELEDFDQNPKLKILKAKRFYDDKQVIIDVGFLIHVIKILIEHYHITICKTDIEEILTYFGTCEVGTKKQIIKIRDVEPATCCGMKEIDVEKIVTVIKKIVLNGCNIAKYFPALVDFLIEIGVSF
jgi:hypothetical protein